MAGNGGDNSMADNSSQIVEDIKWFMFDDERKENRLCC